MTEREIFEEANRAGLKAGNEVAVEPMVVVGADPLTGEPIPGKRWVVDDGLCGFAGVKVRPANCKMANYLKTRGGWKAYDGGVYYPIHEYNQSFTRKEAHAYAFAEVLRSYGVRAYAESRLD